MPEPERFTAVDIATAGLLRHLPAGATNVTVPGEFLDPDTVYMVEVLAIEVSGNQTLTEVAFSTQK